MQSCRRKYASIVTKPGYSHWLILPFVLHVYCCAAKTLVSMFSNVLLKYKFLFLIFLKSKLTSTRNIVNLCTGVGGCTAVKIQRHGPVRIASLLGTFPN